MTFLDAFDIRTAYPLLLALLEVKLDDVAWKAVSSTLESYLLRRAVCGMTTKNYNRVFLGLTRALRRDGLNPEGLTRQLLSQAGESTEWPSEAAFSGAWMTQHAYRVLNNPRIVYILKRVNDTYSGPKTESIPIESPLTVEHILPQQWIENWLLSDGSKGLAGPELWAADDGDVRKVATVQRNALLQTFGNLTILTQALIPLLRTQLGETRSPSSVKHSLLPINLQLQESAVWDEGAIEQRARTLLQRALRLWPRPQAKL